MKKEVWSRPELQLWSHVLKQTPHIVVNKVVKSTYGLVDLFAHEIRDTLIDATIEE